MEMKSKLCICMMVSGSSLNIGLCIALNVDHVWRSTLDLFQSESDGVRLISVLAIHNALLRDPALRSRPTVLWLQSDPRSVR